MSQILSPLAPSEQAQARLLERARAAGLGDVAEKVIAAQRLGLDDGRRLYAHEDLHLVGALANHVRERINGDYAYFNVNQHINYTNYCNKFCSFCSFDKLPGQEGGYLMTPEDAARKVTEQLEEPVTEVHIVGGTWPKLELDYYLDLLRAVKRARPTIHIKAFTMVELDQIRRVAKKSLAETLELLKQAGLDSCPGGGAEVFAERVRQEGYSNKMSGEDWLTTTRAVHQAGLHSNCTMLHGHIETIDERLDHLDRLRRLQDETGGLQAYIPLSFHPENNEWSHLPGPTALDELREIALGRLMLDNIPHIKAYWVLMDVPVAQLCLSYGADDVDGTVVEEKIYHDAGATTPQEVQRADLVQWIRDAGRIPIERDTLYGVVWSGE